MCDETTDITTTKELVLLTRLVDSNGQAKSTFAKVIPLQDGTADTIAAALKTWLQEKNISIKKVMWFGSDGAAMMTGRKNGVAVLLQKENPLMTAIHCICHRLALAVGQAGERVPYIKNHFKPNLGELFRFFAYSACRMARLHQIQKLLDLAQNTLKEAEDTRWLSHDEACKSLYRNLPAVLMTLDNENKISATSTGLLIWLHKYNTLATLYLLCDLLPHLSSLSRCFEQEKIDLQQIDRNVKAKMAVVRSMREGMRPGSRLAKLQEDLAVMDAWRILNCPVMTQSGRGRCQSPCQTIMAWRKFSASLIILVQERE
ncbi:hypothetical protein SKAU_G00415640 [Synaphobranchus kaupii]|uniref:Zinc finger protein 862 n=1 Tax=Synaphobranchus kaupii TaxID=118154 RepID=A0A9Q1IBI4_SYNKA|nr:hypothetical protein SKAU_G00415640 [Synaphobranchus kaupii]